MPDHWKIQLQEIIEISRERIRRLEATELSPRDLEIPVGRKIEAELKTIARLQKTLDALR